MDTSGVEIVAGQQIVKIKSKSRSDIKAIASALQKPGVIEALIHAGRQDEVSPEAARIAKAFAAPE